MKTNYDVIVAGGGWAGTSAAVAAARQGAKTLIIEKSGFLSGSSGNHLVNPFMRYWTKINGERVDLSAGIFAEIVDNLRELGGMHRNERTYNEEILKLVLDRMTEQSGVDVLFHSYLCGVEKEGTVLRSVSCVNKSGTQTYSANYFIDATGDADVSAFAGCPFRLGRDEDQLCQPMTLCFRLSNVDVAKAFQNTKKINDLYAKFRAEGRLQNPREDVLKMYHMDDHIIHLNSTRIIKRSPVNAEELSVAEREAREQTFELYTFLKENCEGFEQAILLASGPSIGVRESRMINGHYILNVDDLKNCTKFEDSIAACNYDIDIHNPSGSGTSHYFFKDGTYYTIPYRCLLPLGTDNLLVAGRCISGSHEAQASYRIMPVCCTLGEAAGTAAALANKARSSVNDIDIKELQKMLRANGAFL